jgi:hypothetical protein
MQKCRGFVVKGGARSYDLAAAQRHSDGQRNRKALTWQWVLLKSIHPEKEPL